MSLTFKAKHGWHMTIFAYGCGAKGSGVSLDGAKTGTHYSFTHFYYGPSRKSGCSASTKLNSGKLHAYWGKLFHLKMTVAGAGSKTAIPVPKNCTGTLGQQRAIKAHGTLSMTIHRRVLGHIRLTHLKGIMQLYNPSKNFNCTGGNHIPKSTFASGTFGTHYLSANKNDHTGATTTYVYGQSKLGSGVFESYNDTFMGGPFTFNKQLTSAKIGGITSFLTGSVSFTGTAQCTSGWETGTWKSGTLKFHDGLSHFSYVGSATVSGYVAKSTAPPCYG